MMPASFLARHRTICAVLEEIKQMAADGNTNGMEQLCDEAITYAQRMSAKLMEYKHEKTRQVSGTVGGSTEKRD